MKHNVLRNIAHNVSSSLASGMGFMIGVYKTDVFQELEDYKNEFMTVDFLKGTITGGIGSASLQKAVLLYRDALSQLCMKQNVKKEDFQELKATYMKGAQRLFLVEIVDSKGRYSKDEYEGLENKKIAKTKTEMRGNL